jgi:GntR family transcriptional repressor for pyruvate dehydrogenase complex
VKPGERLPAERDLAEQLQVSRSSLREALRSLELAGLVDSRHGGGTYIRDEFELNATSPLALILQTSGDNVGDLWEIRIIFEPEIAARAALRADREDLAALDVVLTRQVAHLDQENFSLEIDRDFHMALARASHNVVAVRVIELIGALLRDGRCHFLTTEERRQRAIVCHTAILDAVKAGHPHAARAAMLSHLQEVEAYILGSIVSESTRDDQASPQPDPAGKGVSGTPTR